MGVKSSKEEIIARLDALDKEEIYINKQLRDLQIELNGIVPVKDRVKVKKEYFDNISTDELGKHQENQENEDDGDEIEDENLEEMEQESGVEKEDDSKKKKKKKKGPKKSKKKKMKDN